MDTDVKKWGFKCGVEIHQQLLTDKKLFCRCPAGLYSNEHHAEVLRHMRPTLSEMGVYDGCALMEFKTKKEILYLLNKNSVCTYDMDDTPPFPMNRQALDIAIEIALMMGCSIVDEVHVARKQYLDGSIPTGFQRTAIIGINGSVPFEGKEIKVFQLSIEEDSSREVSDEGHLIKFKTDRLGMPLIEVVTDACFKTPEEAARGVRHLGRILRATKKVRRGVGAVRQDVNVSVEGGKRVEIKGVPRYQLIPELTRNEAIRQHNLLEIRNELAKRKITKENLQTVDVDLTEALKNTCSPILKTAIEAGHRIRGIKLCKLAGLLNHPTQPGRMFASEIAGRVRVIACLDHVPNIFHTDNYPEYAKNHADSRIIRLALELTSADVGVITWGPKDDTITAVDEIKNRIIDALDGVPNETRQRLGDGLTDFERILPGADRMYPDTDHPPIRLRAEVVDEIKKQLKVPTYKVEQELLELGVLPENIAALALSNYVPLMRRLKKEKKNMTLASRLVGSAIRSLKRQGVIKGEVNEDRLYEVVCALEDNKVKTKFFENVLTNAIAYKDRPVAEIIESICVE